MSLVQKAMTGYFHGSDRRLGSPAQVKKRSRMGTSFHAKIGACKQKERYKHIEKRERRRQIGMSVRNIFLFGSFLLLSDISPYLSMPFVCIRISQGEKWTCHKCICKIVRTL